MEKEVLLARDQRTELTSNADQIVVGRRVVVRRKEGWVFDSSVKEKKKALFLWFIIYLPITTLT